MTAIKPGDTVTLYVSDRPDPVTGKVLRVYRDAIASECADIELADGTIHVQILEFLRLATPAKCSICGDPGRPVIEDGYPLTHLTEDLVLCDEADETHNAVRETLGGKR